ALAAAVAGWWAPPAPTGLGWLDPLLRAALAGGLVLVGARARVPALAAAGLVVVVGALDGPVGWLAGGSVGAAIALGATGLDAPAVRGAVAGGVALSAYWLGWPHVALGTAAVAGLALALLATGMSRYWLRLRRRRRRLLRRLGTAAGLAAGVAVLLALFGALRARPSLEEGRSEARAGL